MPITHSPLVGCTLQLSNLEHSLQISLVVFCFSCYASSWASQVRISWLYYFPCYCSVISFFAYHLVQGSHVVLSGSGRLLTAFQSNCGHRDTSSTHSLIRLSTSTVSETWLLVTVLQLALWPGWTHHCWWCIFNLLSSSLGSHFPSLWSTARAFNQLRASCRGFWKETQKDICSKKP